MQDDPLKIGPTRLTRIEPSCLGQTNAGFRGKIVRQQNHPETAPGRTGPRLFADSPLGCFDGRRHGRVEVRQGNRRWCRRSHSIPGRANDDRGQHGQAEQSHPEEPASQPHSADSLGSVSVHQGLLHGRGSVEPILPSPFRKTTTWSAARPGNVSSRPSGQRTSMASMCAVEPRPKWTRGSLLHR